MLFRAAIAVLVVAVALYLHQQGTGGKRSVLLQGVEYLARPNRDLLAPSTAPLEKLDVRSAWTGEYMAAHPEEWIAPLTPAEVSSIEAAMRHFEATNKSVERMDIADFPLSGELVQRIEHWKRELGPSGRGFQVVRGVPVHRWSMRQCEAFFWAFGRYLGVPGAQDMAGSLLGHVTNVGPTNVTERPYRQNVHIDYHCDGADVVGLLCVHPAKSGGASRIVSSVSVFNRLLDLPRGQEYARRLFRRVMLFTRKTFGVSRYLSVPPLRMDRAGTLRTYWNQEYFLKAYRSGDGQLTEFGEKDPTALAAVEAYDSILTGDAAADRSDTTALPRLGLDMVLQQGDVQLVSNHFVMHARTEFQDYSQAEIDEAAAAASAAAGGAGADAVIGPIGRRDLLRLWVSESKATMGWTDFLSEQAEVLGVLGALLEGALFYR